jgi:tetratricopeptide (TPR) repeat protein
VSGPRRLSIDLSDFPNIFSQFVLSTPRRVAIVAALALTVTGVTTGVLARDYHDARRATARTYFATAEREAAAGRAEDAVLHYRAALSLERDTVEYRRRLAVMLLDLRRIGEAQSRLDELLLADPIDGEANLLRGRVAASQGNWREAEAYYQRAIYGRWADADTDRRLATRYELIDLFEQIGATTQARAELLRLQSDLPEVPFLQQDVARHFLRLGDPEQAAAVLRRAVAARPGDAWLLGDLSEAELKIGRLAEARDAARRALAVDGSDSETRARLAAISDALALDPAGRGLSTRERHRRSGLLLRRALDELTTCLARPGQPPTDGTSSLLALAQSLLDTAPRTAVLDDQVMNRLALAEQVWQERTRRCGASTEPVAWLFDRLSH